MKIGTKFTFCAAKRYTKFETSGSSIKKYMGIFVFVNIYESLSAGRGKGPNFVKKLKKLWLSIQPIDCFNLDFLFI